jgi:hypothetical protein
MRNVHIVRNICFNNSSINSADRGGEENVNVGGRSNVLENFAIAACMPKTPGPDPSTLSAGTSGGTGPHWREGRLRIVQVNPSAMTS